MTDSRVARRRATYDDVLRAPRHVVAEIIDGVLYSSPRPTLRHGRSEIRLGARLDPFQEGGGDPGGWWIQPEPELHLGSDVLVPDLAGWRSDRVQEFPDLPYSTVAPDWLCEVLSPSTKRLDRTKKLSVYARECVSHVWLIDPIAKTLEVLRLSRRRLVLDHTYRDDDRVRAVPFDAVEIALDALWPPPVTRTTTRTRTRR